VTVTLRVWRVRPAAIPRTFWTMAVDRGRLRRSPGVRFAKLLGTTAGSRFGLTSADLTRWASLVVSAGPAPGIPRVRAVAECTVTLRPIASRGSWAGAEPFGDRAAQRGPNEKILVLTRARLRAVRAPRFWAAIDPVGKALPGREGLHAAFGIGEAPIGFQGTFSLWDSAAALREFAYAGDAHRAVVARTGPEGWFAEELFARFAVEAADGSVDGRDPLA
jgi:hypothetical protein